MKRMIFIVCTLIAYSSYGQSYSVSDTLKFNSGKINVGNISDITRDNVYFSPKGENTSYVYHKEEIAQVIFGNGRIEYYSKPRETSSASTKEIIKNSVAILPFIFNSEGFANDNIPFDAQDAFHRKISEKSGTYVYQDVYETNILLKRSGIDVSVRNYTPSELCKILGVEWIVLGSVTRAKVSNTIKEDYSRKTDTSSLEKEKTEKYTQTNEDNFNSTVTIKVYNAKGEKSFDQNWLSFYPTYNAYLSGIDYLAKRTPLYKTK
ncbi:hypothetical protein [Solitalea canadensis]|uniref:Uncharacterized protein n=1 Tax=Solitalea canadensis (strain ATCC 29591 / DSM 3403 / JCM 21819 / LMG 8368 / NBRC 15130 / NCIMB 12057 / USAM 9D) TaxID=929556 RepID=H8KLN7_SOLCM|nr:hypothetical protein [Solitalea canadensis]AFD09191.1 hypothetical protein Solca_4201 [Solitalea canadensis DSM 3403]